MAQPAKNKFNFSQKTVRLKKGNVHTASIIWMHGLGDTANGWTDALRAIQQKLPHIQCILPTAPSLAITFQGGMKTTAWHDIEDLQNLQNNSFKYKEDSRILINELIDTEINQKGIDPSRIILGGFSQGAAMAIYCGLQYGKPLGGIVALSGYLCDMNIVKAVKDDKVKATPIIMYHGANDMIVQTQYGRLSAMLLKTNGFNDTVWEEFNIPMQMNFGHNVVQDELNKVAKFVNKNLPKEFKPKKEQKNEEKNDGSNEKKEQSNVLEFLGDKFLCKDGKSVSADRLKGMDMIGIYFSAHWCPPCRQFTPMLTECYTKWKKDGVKIEIIFASSDQTAGKMKEYFSEQGDWLAIEFGSGQTDVLSKKYGVRGIPTLVVIDSEGNIIDANGRGTVSQKGNDAIKSWTK